MEVFTPQYSHLVALAFMGMCGLPVAGVLFSFLKPVLAKFAMAAVGAAAGAYLVMLLGLSLASKDTVLETGQLKYFCELDCHQAYSVQGVTREPNRAVVAVKAWFDPDTTSPKRGDSPLTFDNRQIELVDSQGRRYAPAPVDLRRALRPGESFVVDLAFPVPSDARDLRLLITEPDHFPTQLLLGHENSLLHKKIWFKVS